MPSAPLHILKDKCILENFSKKKRGRPRLLSLEYETALKQLYAGIVNTRRSLQNKSYEARASGLLQEYPDRFLWLRDKQKSEKGMPKALKQTILSELGRIDEDSVLLQMADLICEKRMATGEAVGWIRIIRRQDKGV